MATLIVFLSILLAAVSLVAADSLQSAKTCYRLREYYTENALKRVNAYGLSPSNGGFGGGGFFGGDGFNGGSSFSGGGGSGFNNNPCKPVGSYGGFSDGTGGGSGEPLANSAGSGSAFAAASAPASGSGNGGTSGGSFAAGSAFAAVSAPASGSGSGSGSASAAGGGGGGGGGGAAVGNASPQVAGVDFSNTNVQIEGVDEPDVIKTDGRRVFVIRGRDFFVVKVGSSSMSGTVAGNLTLPSYAKEMVIEGDTILVIASEYGDIESNSPSGGVSSFSFGSISRSFFLPFGSSLTTVYKIRVVEYTPRLVATMRIEGRYISAREVAGTARIIISTNRVNNKKFPRNCDTAASAIARHQASIRIMQFTDWVPRYTVTGSGCSYHCTTGRPRPLTKCSNVYLPTTDFTGFTLLSVVTLPMSGTFIPGRAVSIASEGSDVFSTASTLYVTGTKYRYDFAADSLFFGASFTTSLHKFALSKYGAKYSASGAVTGSVLNQFSMHEYLGVFFVATTEGALWWTGRDQSKSKVTSFKQSRNKLAKLGEVGNLGLGERIYSVRYVADICYVVTFRQVDPLYVLDLSNPRLLRVTGELKIPGFSSYLHPLDAGLILGVGQDATPDGRTTGAKVSLFDVSNVNVPREVAVWTELSSSTNAQFDHRAFLFWKPKSLLVLSLNIYDSDSSKQFYGSIVLKITPGVIVEVGRVQQPVGQYGSSPSIQRNLVLGRTNLWSMSRVSLQVNDIDSLAVKSVIKLE